MGTRLTDGQMRQSPTKYDRCNMRAMSKKIQGNAPVFPCVTQLTTPLDTAGATSWSDEVKTVLKRLNQQLSLEPSPAPGWQMAGWQDGGGRSGCNLYVTPASLNRTNGIHISPHLAPADDRCQPGSRASCLANFISGWLLRLGRPVDC